MKSFSPGSGSFVRQSNKKVFRSVDEWKSALMILPDSNFFELLRSVFGNIKTPFSKQRLLNDLFVFLFRNDIQKIIAAYINEKDHKIISAVALLDEPTSKDMEIFFVGEFSGAEIHSLIINLEERLILYRINVDGVLCLALNPVLEQVLAPLVADTRPLFPSFPKESGPPQEHTYSAACIPDGRIMTALFSFISGEEELFKSEGGLRKKILDDGKKFFPSLDLELAVKALLLLGLFRRGTLSNDSVLPLWNSRTRGDGSGDFPGEGRCLVPCKDKIDDYGDLSPLERQAYWAGGVYFCLNEAAQDGSVSESQERREDGRDGQAKHCDAGDSFLDDGSGLYSRTRLRGVAFFIHRLVSLLNFNRKYPEITIRRLGELLERQGAWSFSAMDANTQLSFELLLAAMEKTGILEKAGSCWKAGPGLAAVMVNDPANEAEKPVIAMDTAFSIILYPEITFADALELGTFCSLKRNTETEASQHKEPAAGSGGMAETAICFELTRQSVIRGFDHGMSADAMTELLNRLSLNRIDANLGWTLNEWEKRYAGVSLHQGIILTLAEDCRYLAEVKPVASLIHQTLAPGVYLLSSNERSEAVKALRKAGVDIVAQPPSVAFAAFPAASARKYGSFSRLDSTGIIDLGGITADAEESPDSAPESSDSPRESGAIQKKFFRILEKMQLSKPERDELTARIDRRLVLSEAQLEKSSLRYEKLEARGIDYSGKLAIAKQAADSGSLVEISMPCPDGSASRTVGFVEALEKKEGEYILILKSFNREDGNTIRIPVGKISLLRRIKRSIFGE